MKKYRIICKKSYNQIGEIDSTLFYIEELKKDFFGQLIWKYITSEDGWGSTSRLNFRSFIECEEFLLNILSKNLPRDSYTYDIIKEYEFN